MFRKTLILLAALLGSTGCTNLDLVSRTFDMASERIDYSKPVYEGRLQSVQHVGPMVALQFSDGNDFDVSECPATLVPGDDVRIYQMENGYVAHLWRSSRNQLKS
jgi:hypothetical protein